ncbi:MAG: hypothetical protein A2Y22_05510 [Clostridiales bacterium GWD2_32_59]|nr:MAG: hypothetical protein A2Y22_05510 [Clostridiales bacterium GWD2_32_59]
MDKKRTLKGICGKYNCENRRFNRYISHILTIVILIMLVMPVSITNADATSTVSISGGYSHTTAVKNDGTVWVWGYNSNGQLGDNTTQEQHAPIQVPGIADVSQVSGGYLRTTALKMDGTVYTWGYNPHGELGDNTVIEKHTPVQVLGVGGTGNISEIIQVADGLNHEVALKKDGTVYAWGYNASGQLGNNSTAEYHYPVQVKGVGVIGNLSGIVQVAAGDNHTVALREDGTVYAWGYNGNGQLGNNSGTASSTPVQVVGAGGTGILTEINQIAASGNYTLALKNDGTVYAWGYNDKGQLGDNTVTQKLYPVQVLGGLSGVTQIAAASSTVGSTAMALKSDGTVYAWGYNNVGQIGDGTVVEKHIPVQVLGGLSGVTKINIKKDSAVALVGDGTLYTWGDNTYGALGNNTTTPSTTPVHVLDVGGIGNINLGAGAPSAPTGVAVTPVGGTLIGNKLNKTNTNMIGVATIRMGEATGGHADLYVGETLIATDNILAAGDGKVTFNLGQTAAAVQAAAVQAAVVSGGNVKVRLTNAGGYYTDSILNNPTLVVDYAGSYPPVTPMVGGTGNTVALKNDGSVWTWGNNNYGLIGNNTLITTAVPTQVLGVGGTGTLTGITQVSATGSTRTTAVKGSDGTVYAWGYNAQGQLGNNTQTSSKTPVQVVSTTGSGTLTGIVQIAAGASYTLALGNNGTVYAWGANASGQLGNNTLTSSAYPVQVLGTGGTGALSGITQIATAGITSMALANDGTVYTWGYNGYGQIGDSTTTVRKIPVAVKGVGGVLTLGGVTQISAGSDYMVALKTDGTVYAWGNNNYN